MTSIDIVLDFLLWGAIVNYVVLIAWFVTFISAHQALYALHAKWFKLSLGQFDAIHYAGMTGYKIAVLSLNVVPYIALRIAARHGL